MTLKRKFLSRDFYKMELIELYLNISNVYKLSLGKEKKGQLFYFQKISVTFTQRLSRPHQFKWWRSDDRSLRVRISLSGKEGTSPRGVCSSPWGLRLKNNRLQKPPQDSLFLQLVHMCPDCGPWFTNVLVPKVESSA